MPPATNFQDALQRVAALLWPGDPVAQSVLICVLVIAAIACAALYRPVIVLLGQLARLQDTLARFDREMDISGRRDRVIQAFAASPLAHQWRDFQRRWESAVGELPISDPELACAPVRLSDILDEHPVLAAGTERSLLTLLPALLLGLGLLGSMATLGLIPQPIAQPNAESVSEFGSQLGKPIAQPIANASALLLVLGEVLPATIWGLLLALASMIAGRSLTGRCDAESKALDRRVARAFGSISRSELEYKTAREQIELLEAIHRETAALLKSSSPLTESDSTLFGDSAHPIADFTTGPDPQAAAALEALERVAETANLQSAATTELIEAGRTLSETAKRLRASIDSLPPLARDLRDAGAALADGVAGSEEAERGRTQAVGELRQLLTDGVAEISAALEKLTSANAESIDAAHHTRGPDASGSFAGHAPPFSPAHSSPSPPAHSSPSPPAHSSPSPPAPPPLPLDSVPSDSVYAAGSRLAAAEASVPAARDEETAHDRPVSLASLLSRHLEADPPEAEPGTTSTTPGPSFSAPDEAEEAPPEPNAGEEPGPEDEPAKRGFFHRS